MLRNLIPFVTQLGWGYSNLCGSANIAMWRGAYNRETVSPVSVARALNVLGSFTTIGQMLAGLTLAGIPAYPESGATWAVIKRAIDANYPVIALVDYRKFKNNPRGYRYAHFVTVLGYTETHVIIHDPLQFIGSTFIPFDEFLAAIASPSLYNDSGTPQDESDDLVNRPFQAIIAAKPLEARLNRALAGMNTDPRNPIGNPSALQLQGFGWVRFPYKVSLGKGSTDLKEPFDKYSPIIQALSQANIGVISVLNHETYGEAQGYNWTLMNATLWDKLIGEFVPIARAIAAQYKGLGIVWQIWNEGDHASEAAVYMPPAVYGKLFRQVRGAIKAVDPTAKVITQGYVSGTMSGPAYHRATGLTKNEIDGIGVHMYLARAAGYGTSPSFEKQFEAWSVFGSDIYVTEFGQPANPSATDQGLADYALAALNAGKNTPAQAVSMVWFAWADGMHTSIGVVKTDGSYRAKLREALTSGIMPSNTPPKPNGVPVGRYRIETSQIFINARTEADTSAPIAVQLRHGDTLDVVTVEVSEYNDGFHWQKFQWDGKDVWVAIMTSYRLVPIVTGEPSDDVWGSIKAHVDSITENLTAINALLESVRKGSTA